MRMETTRSSKDLADFSRRLFCWQIVQIKSNALWPFLKFLASSLEVLLTSTAAHFPFRLWRRILLRVVHLFLLAYSILSILNS